MIWAVTDVLLRPALQARTLSESPPGCCQRCAAVGDPALTYHGISYGTQLGAIYANLFPGRVRAMVFDGSIDFEGNISGHGSEGATVPLNTRQDVPVGTASAFDEFLRDCSTAGRRCAFSGGDPWTKWAALTERFRRSPVLVYGHPWTLPEIAASTLAVPRAT